MSTSLYIGTAGWSYPHWKGVVFPKAMPGGLHPLELLARTFDAVEINSSFYQALKPEITMLWMKKTERYPRFQFTAKLHQQFTHQRLLEDAEIARFKEGLQPLLGAGKLGALLMQFPWAFRFTAENREFLIRLRRAFHEFPLVSEMRHASWLAGEAVGTFLDYRIGFCNIDQPEYTSAMPPTAYLTSGVGYVRLHGRNPKNALGGFQRRGEPSTRMRQHDYLYSEAELEEWSKRLERIAKFAEKTFVIFNNDAAGKSVVNALQLQSLVQGRVAAAPRELRRKYPMQLERFGPARFEQQRLFPAA
ncbi:MAG TPA: DUF72 domain-containing protein [Bryobacteraceae bacterium]|nr:DUF72 domain-containing protein [Bryobacteraceae bacterium]